MLLKLSILGQQISKIFPSIILFYPSLAKFDLCVTEATIMETAT